jgi:hypothetical protein
MKGATAVAASAALGGSALLSGCTIGAGDLGAAPACDEKGHPAQAVVLMAQAVPTAPFLPCVRLMPVGWRLTEFEIRTDLSRFTLDSDRYGVAAVTVRLTESCDVRGATKVPSDHVGMDRYERVTRVTDGFTGSRFYVAPGGCVTYDFNLQGSSLAIPVNEASLAMGFVPRDAVRAKVLRDSEGELTLDPPPREG